VRAKRSPVALWAVLVELCATVARAQEAAPTAVAPASEAPASAAPSFEVPDHCGTEPDFRRELGKLVGNDLERAWPATVRITATPADPGAYHLTLDVRGVRRELEHADCRVLFRSAIVIAAASVRIDQPVAEEPPPAAKQQPPPEPVKAPPPPARGAPGPKLRGNVGLGAGLGVGVVPGATATFDVRFGGELGRARASLAVRYFLPRHVSVEGRGADIQGVGGRLAVGYVPIDPLALSAGFDADWLFGEGKTGIDSPALDSAWTLAPSLEVALIPIRTRRLSLELSAEGRVQVQRPVFEVTGFRELYRVPRFALISLARGVWHFP
jgi:hypothetical protein